MRIKHSQAFFVSHKYSEHPTPKLERSLNCPNAMSIFVDYVQDDRGDRDHKIAHITSGLLSLNVIDQVLDRSSLVLDGVIGGGKKCDELRTLWLGYLREFENVPIPAASEITDDETEISRRLSEPVPPYGKVEGIEGRPEKYMIKPDLVTKQKPVSGIVQDTLILRKVDPF